MMSGSIRVTAPCASAGYGRKDAAELLLDAGATVEALNNDQQSPADAAKVRCVRQLASTFRSGSVNPLASSDDNMPETCVTVHFMTSAGQPRNAHGHIPKPEGRQKARLSKGDLLVANFAPIADAVCVHAHA